MPSPAAAFRRQGRFEPLFARYGAALLPGVQAPDLAPHEGRQLRRVDERREGDNRRAPLLARLRRLGVARLDIDDRNLEFVGLVEANFPREVGLPAAHHIKVDFFPLRMAVNSVDCRELLLP